MFESLKQQPRGFSPRDKTRLYLRLSLIAMLGVGVFGGAIKAFAPDGGPAPLATVAGRAPATTRPLDPLPLARLRAGEGPTTELAVEPLRHVLAEVAYDRALRRAGASARRGPDTGPLLESAATLAAPPADLAALDPAASAGLLVETRGTVRAVAEVTAKPAGFGDDRRLFVASVAGDDGTVVLVLDGEAPAARRPGTEPRETVRVALEADVRVHVRGYYLQRFQGSLGSVGAPAPTVVLVGRDYRPAVDAPSSVPTFEDATASGSPDRTRVDTWSVEDPAYWMTMHAVAAAGNPRLVESLVRGGLRWSMWGRPQFLTWSRELSLDAPGPDGRLPATDPRAFTNASRGKVFLLRGVLAAYEHDDWDRVPDNAYDVSRRFVYRLVSDHYVADALVRLDSPFPIATFPGVGVPDPKRPQRVRAYGVFLRNHSYAPAGPSDPVERARFEAREDRELTVPMFVALHLEPDPLPPPGPLWKNPFFWTWVGLAVFFVGFFFVMRRMDRRDDDAAERRDVGRRRRIFDHFRAKHGVPHVVAKAPPPPSDPEPPA